MTLRRVGFRLAGWLLLIVPFLPTRALFDDPPGTTWLIGPGEWLLGLSVFVTAGWLLARLVPDAVPATVARLGATVRQPGFAAFRAGALAVLAALLFLTSTYAFGRAPLLIDSIIQLFQARIFAGGAAFAPAPPLEGFFTTQHMLVDGGRWYAQYPPGHSAALVPGVWLGAPWLVPIAMTLASAWLIGDVTRRLFGDDTARLALLLLLLAPFFWFMGASHMNHVSALLFIALGLWAIVRWEGSRHGAGSGEGRARQTAPGSETTTGGDPGGTPPGSIAWIGLAGAALGAAFLSRPLTALAAGAALAIPVLRTAGRRWWRVGLVGGLAFVALASLYFAYNAATTGGALTPGYLKLWGAEHGLGFHATPWGDEHTPLTGLRNELIDLGLLNGFLFEWAIPALLPLGLYLVWRSGSGGEGPSGAPGREEPRGRGAPGTGRRIAWEGRLLVAFFAIPAAYFFYWHRDAFLGPRYLYEGLAFLVPLLAVSFLGLRERLRDVRLRALGGVDASALFASVVGLSVLYSVLYGTPQRFRVYATGMESLKRDLVAEAEAAGIERGLVFVAVSWGNRLIARARAAGASASVAEIVYRNSDHCELERVVSRAEAEGWPEDRLDRELLAIRRPESEIEVVRLNEDPTLRLVPDRPLAEECADQILHDREGYTNFSPHLARNAPGLDGRFVFARDLRERNAELRALYAATPAYLYRDGRFIALP